MTRGEKNKVARCGSKKTASGKPCRYTKPCPYHDQGGGSKRAARRARGGALRAQQAVRQEKVIQGLLTGKTVKQASRDAGYADTVAEGKIYQIMDTPAMQQRVDRTIALAQLQTEEVIGRVVGMMRMDIADLFPEDPFLKTAQERGISQNIKKVKRIPIITGYAGEDAEQPVYEMQISEVEIYSAHDAAKTLTEVFGLKQMPAPNQKAMRDFQSAVVRICQAVRDSGVTVPEDELRARVAEKLKPRYLALLKGNVAHPLA